MALTPEKYAQYLQAMRPQAATPAGGPILKPITGMTKLPEVKPYVAPVQPEYKPAPRQNTFGDNAADTGRLLLKGVAGTGGDVGFGLEKAGLETAGRALQKSDTDVQKRLNERMTPSMQEAARQPLLDENNHLNPDFSMQSLAANAIPSIPSMAVMAATGGPLAGGAGTLLRGAGLGVKAAELGGTGLGFGASEGVVSGVENAKQFGEDQRAAGVDQEAINKGQADIFGKTALTTGAIGAVTGGGMLGSLMRKGSPLAVPLADAAAGVAEKSLYRGVINSSKEIAKDAALEGGQEAPQSALEQLHVNQATKDYVNPNQDLSEGVANAAATGGLAGGALGAFGAGGHQLINVASKDLKKQIDDSAFNPAPTKEELDLEAAEKAAGYNTTDVAVADSLRKIRDIDPTDPGIIQMSQPGGLLHEDTLKAMEAGAADLTANSAPWSATLHKLVTDPATKPDVRKFADKLVDKFSNMKDNPEFSDKFSLNWALMNAPTREKAGASIVGEFGPAVMRKINSPTTPGGAAKRMSPESWDRLIAHTDFVHNAVLAEADPALKAASLDAAFNRLASKDTAKQVAAVLQNMTGSTSEETGIVNRSESAETNPILANYEVPGMQDVLSKWSGKGLKSTEQETIAESIDDKGDEKKNKGYTPKDRTSKSANLLRNPQTGAVTAESLSAALQPAGVKELKQAPVAQAPVAQAPVAQAPVAQAPVAQAPVAQAPVAQAPIAQAPVAQAPVAPSIKPLKKEKNVKTNKQTKVTPEAKAPGTETDYLDTPGEALIQKKGEEKLKREAAVTAVEQAPEVDQEAKATSLVAGMQELDNTLARSVHTHTISGDHTSAAAIQRMRVHLGELIRTRTGNLQNKMRRGASIPYVEKQLGEMHQHFKDLVTAHTPEAKDAPTKAILAMYSEKTKTGGMHKDKVTKALKKWGFAGKMLGTRIRVVQTAAEANLPARAKAHINQHGDITLVADHITSDVDARAVLLHELGVHSGMTVAEVSHFAEVVKGWGASPEGSMQRKVFEAAVARVASASRHGLPAGMRNEELVAYAVEEAVNAGVSPASIVGQWLRSLRNWLAQKFGFPEASITAEDLVNYAYGAANMERGFSQVQSKFEAPAYSFVPVIEKGKEVGEKVFGRGKPLHGVAKLWRHQLNGMRVQLDKRLGYDSKMAFYGKRISEMVDHYFNAKDSATAAFHAIAKKANTALVDVSNIDEQMHTSVGKMLNSEMTRAEAIEANEPWLPDMQRVITLKSGEKVDGFEIVRRARKALQDEMIAAAHRGVWMISDREKAVAVMNAAEPVYWHRSFDRAKIKAHQDEFVKLMAEDPELQATMFKGKDALAEARKFIDKIVTNDHEDPLLMALNAGMSEGNKEKSEGLIKAIGAFRADEERVFEILAKALSAKNRRTLDPETAARLNALGGFYKEDLSAVLQSYTTAIGARVAVHEAAGGYISDDHTRYAKDLGERSRAIELHAKAIRNEDAAFGRTIKKPWQYKLLAEERVAEDAALHYSPVAGLEFQTKMISKRGQEMYNDDGRAKENTDWLRQTYFPGVFNQLGQDITPALRKFNEYASVALRTITLPFATISSLVEPASIGVRAAGAASGQNVLQGTGQAVGSLLKLGLTKEGRALRKERTPHLQDIGVVSTERTRSAISSMESDVLTNKRLHKFSEAYFKAIGLNLWTNMMGHVAYDIALKQIDEFAQSNTNAAAAEMKALGVTKDQWLAYEADPLPPNATGIETSDHLGKHKQAYQAINKWVNGGRLKPNATNRTTWGNNPKYALLWMLNDFPFTFGDKTLGRIGKLAAENPTKAGQIISVMLAGVAFMALGMLSVGIKDLIRSSLPWNKDEAKILHDDIATSMGRSLMGPGNIFGQYEKILKMGQDVKENYAGLAPVKAFGGVALNVGIDANSLGLTTALLRSSTLMDKSSKGEVTKMANELENDTRDFFGLH